VCSSRWCRIDPGQSAHCKTSRVSLSRIKSFPGYKITAKTLAIAPATISARPAVTIPLNPAHEKQYDEDDQDDSDDTYATMTEAVTVAAEAATEATKQENDENDDKYESERHDLPPVSAPTRHFVA
jgi:hypothetical protein